MEAEKSSPNMLYSAAREVQIELFIKSLSLKKRYMLLIMVVSNDMWRLIALWAFTSSPRLLENPSFRRARDLTWER